MQAAKKLGIAGLAAIGLYMLSISGAASQIGSIAAEHLGESRMKNVSVTQEAEPVTPVAATVKASPKPAAPATAMPSMEPIEPEKLSVSYDSSGQSQILETNIQGGLSIKNETAYWVDASQIVAEGPGISLTAGEPQILIIHTHSSEAYTQAGLDRYEASDTNRTEDTEFNIVRIGDELTELLQQAGLNVIHDRGIYDYPSYTGSYTRSGQAVEQYLEAYPSIAIVIDMHRDALGTDDVVYKTMAEEDGVCASQIMLLVGSDESGLEHPNWRQNLSLALYLQNAVNLKHPTLMRPVSLVRQRYNQHLSTGSMILEVGSSGNTLQEALAAIRLFADAAAPALAELVK
jgi:stage II sporulation protein P